MPRRGAPQCHCYKIHDRQADLEAMVQIEEVRHYNMMNPPARRQHLKQTMPKRIYPNLNRSNQLKWQRKQRLPYTVILYGHAVRQIRQTDLRQRTMPGRHSHGLFHLPGKDFEHKGTLTVEEGCERVVEVATGAKCVGEA